MTDSDDTRTNGNAAYFTLFPESSDKESRRQARRAFFLVIIPYLLILVLLIVEAYGVAHARAMDDAGRGSFVIIRVLVSGQIAHLGFFGLGVVVWLYFRWKGQVTPLFCWLYESGRLKSSDGKLQEEYPDYLQAYKEKLFDSRQSSRWGLRLLLVVVAMMPIIALSNVPDYVAHYLPAGQAAVVLLGVTAGVWVYLGGGAAWQQIATVEAIRELPTRFDIILKPGHPDQCGGLKRLGDFCSAMALPVIVLGFTLAMIGGAGKFIGGSDTGRVIYESAGFVAFEDSPADLALVVLFLIVAPLIAITFFAPLWSVHEEMRDQKRAAEDEYANRLTALLQQIRIDTDDEGDLGQAKQTSERLEIFRKVDPNEVGFPEWPFSYRTVIGLFSSQLAVVATLLLERIYTGLLEAIS